MYTHTQTYIYTYMEKYIYSCLSSAIADGLIEETSTTKNSRTYIIIAVTKGSVFFSFYRHMSEPLNEEQNGHDPSGNTFKFV